MMTTILRYSCWNHVNDFFNVNNSPTSQNYHQHKPSWMSVTNIDFQPLSNIFVFSSIMIPLTLILYTGNHQSNIIRFAIKWFQILWDVKIGKSCFRYILIAIESLKWSLKKPTVWYSLTEWVVVTTLKICETASYLWKLALSFDWRYKNTTKGRKHW